MNATSNPNREIITPDSAFAQFVAAARFALDERRTRYATALGALAVKARTYRWAELAEIETELSGLSNAQQLPASNIVFTELRRLRSSFERDTLAILSHLPKEVKAAALGENVTHADFTQWASEKQRAAA